MKKIFVLILVLASILRLNAVQAYTGAIKITQPNGYQLEAFMRGDENFDYKTSRDQYVLLPDNEGYLTYAQKKADGELTASTVRAHNIPERTAEEIAFLQTIQPNLSFGTKTMTKVRQRVARIAARTGSVPITGSPHFLVLLINYADNSFAPANNQSRFNDQLNGINYTTSGATGSATKYFSDNSMTAFTPVFDVFGPVTLSQPMAYYGGDPYPGTHDIRRQEMIYEACQLLDGSVDFSQYDTDADGNVDNIFVIYAGYSQAASGISDAIWPHASSITGQPPLDGKYIGRYACSSELQGSAGTTIDGIGIMCHEFSHVLGLPDFYDTNYSTDGMDFGTDGWDLMGIGCYNNGSKTPPYYTGLEREMLNWASSSELSSNGRYNLTTVATNQYRWFSTKTAGEKYYLENRQKKGWDTFIPAAGLMIYHMDRSAPYSFLWDVNMINAFASHPCMKIKSAGNTYGTVSSIPFPGSQNNKELTDYSTPNMLSWAGAATEKPISNITVENDSTISFNFRSYIGVNKLTNFGKLTPGNTSVEQSLTVSGNSLTADITITPPVGFEISSTAGSGFVTYPSSIVLPKQEDGTIAPTTLYVRFKPTTYQAFSTNIVLTSDAIVQIVPVLGQGNGVFWTGASSSDWFDASNWISGSVPTTTIDVIIPADATNMPVIANTPAYCQDIRIESGATLTVSGSQELAVSGNWLNNGTFNAGTGSVRFYGAMSLQTIAGTATTTFNNLKVEKTSVTNILEATSLISLSGTTNPLVITTGTFKLSSASTITPFTSEPTIGLNCGLWNNGGTINSGNFNWNLNAGTIRLSAGTINVGTNSDNMIYYRNNASCKIEGGTMNIAGRFAPNSSISTVSYNQSGGHLTVNTMGSTSIAAAPFHINSVGTFIMNGGTITIQNASSYTADYVNLATTQSVTGGTIEIGNNATTDSPEIRINSSVPVHSLTINGTGTPTAKLLSNLTVQSSLTINSGGTLTIGAGKQLTAISAFTNNGILNMLSDATSGTGTILTPATIAGSGVSNVQQYLNAVRNWYISAPVQGATAPTGNTYYKYVEAENNGSTWTSVNAGDQFDKMTGYVIQPSEAKTFTFSGTLNTGNQTISGLTATATTKTGFNLVGNPYPAYVNWQLASRTNLEPTMWYRCKNTVGAYVFDTYGAISGVGTNNNGTAVTNYIPPMQAFWVRVTAGTAGTLAFDNNMCSHQDISTNKFRTASINQNQQVLRLKVSNGTNSDETIVLFNSNASNDYDLFDSPKMSNGNAAIPEIYTLAGKEKLVINGLTSSATNPIIPLGFTSGSTNTFSIQATQLSNFDSSTSVIVRDNLLNTEQDITDGTAYSFSSNATSTESRFSIILRTAQLTTPLNNLTENTAIKVACNAASQIVITGIMDQTSTVTIINAVGQKLYIAPTKGYTTIINNYFAKGIYFVIVSESGKNTTKKLIID